jgi:hypothetical protein
MQHNQLEAKMMKQIGVSLQSIEWFILQGFIKNIVESEELVKANFKTVEDCAVIEGILDKIQKQFAPHLEDNTEAIDSIEHMLGMKPKELYIRFKPIIL